MEYSDTVAEVHADITNACARFVAQVSPMLRLRSLAVVLLEPEGDTSRVVFSWGDSHQYATPVGPPFADQPSSTIGDRHTFSVPLEGRRGPLGALLCRSDGLPGFGLDLQTSVRRWACQLALELENIQLQHRLERGRVENQVFSRISELVSSDRPEALVYRRFASEVNRLLDFQRLSIYLADPEADLLTCAFRVGLGAGRRDPRQSRALKGPAGELTISRAQGFSLEDGPRAAVMDWPELSADNRLRSALVAPIGYGGKAVGAVVLQNRWPVAYGTKEQGVLQRAVSLLGPRIANTLLDSQLNRKAQEMALVQSLDPSDEDFPWPLHTWQRELLAEAAHALRSPLAAIKGYSSALLQPDVDWPPELHREFLATIDRESDRLNQVVTDLMTRVQGLFQAR